MNTKIKIQILINVIFIIIFYKLITDNFTPIYLGLLIFATFYLGYTIGKENKIQSHIQVPQNSSQQFKNPRNIKNTIPQTEEQEFGETFQ